MTEDSLRRRIKSLQTLVDRSSGGEKVNAQELLNKILDKYDITLDEVIKDEEVKYYDWHYCNWYEEKLLVQVMCKVLGDQEWQLMRTRYRRQRDGVCCTAAQALEIELEYEFHCKMFEEDLRIFLRSYVQKNRLFGPADPNYKPTPEEQAEIFRATQMEQGLDRHVRRLMIEEGREDAKT